MSFEKLLEHCSKAGMPIQKNKDDRLKKKDSSAKNKYNLRNLILIEIFIVSEKNNKSNKKKIAIATNQVNQIDIFLNLKLVSLFHLGLCELLCFDVTVIEK
jgi:hypothetical protein